MTRFELEINIPDEVLGYLENEAQRRKVPLGQVISDVLVNYFDDPTDEEILESIRDGMKDALAGRTRPADEAIAELKRELGFDADET